MSRNWKLLALAGVMAGAAIGAGTAPADAQVKRGGTLMIARHEEPLTLDPFIPSDNGSIYTIAQICESLISPDKDGTGLEPGLAESWEAGADGMSITFKLRQGVKFSDGSAMTADDVVYSLQKVADPKAAYGFAFEPVSAIEKIDDVTVKITLKTPYAALQSALSLFSSSVVSKAAHSADAAAFGSKPTCTGPWQIEAYERGSQVVLVPNANYWKSGEDGKPLPYMDKVVIKYIPESNSRVLGLQNGDYDVAINMPLNQAEAIKAMDGVTLEVAPAYRLDYVYLNHAKKPIDDKRIRLALNHAANREAIMKVVYFGYGEIPNGFTPKMNFWSETVEKIPYDIEKAKALLAEAGYDGTPIQLMVDTGNAPNRQIATILQQGWQEAGLKVEIVEFDGGTSFGMVQKGDFQAYVSYITSDINDDDELVSLQGAGEGSTEAFFSRYKSEEASKLIAEARQSLDPAKRKEIYGKIQDIVYHDGYSVPLNYPPYVNGVRNHVKNWKNIAVGWWWLHSVWMDK